MGLCPFAGAALDGGAVRYTVSTAKTASQVHFNNSNFTLESRVNHHRFRTALQHAL
jgi:hypothetical protein